MDPVRKFSCCFQDELELPGMTWRNTSTREVALCSGPIRVATLLAAPSRSGWYGREQPLVPDEDACGFRPDRTMTATDESRRSAKRYKRSNDPPFFWDASRRHQRSPSDEGGGAISRRRPQTDIHSPPPLLLQKRVETQKSVHKCVSRMPCPHNLREACIFSAEGVAT